MATAALAGEDAVSVDLKHLFVMLAVAFLLVGLMRLARDRGKWHPQSGTWLAIGVIFAGVGLWLW
jgi:hypothetical protein